jgi:monoamine oxidase
VAISRRSFLIAAAAPLAGAALGCGNGDRGRVLVVGGGLAGLVALDLLRKAGRDALLLEAGTRLGGRIYTRRTEESGALPAGLRAELGAERVGIEDSGVRGLMSELGIPTVSYPPTTRLVLEWKGTHVVRDFSELPRDLFSGLSPLEKDAAPIGILHALVESSGPPAADDTRSGIEWLRSIGMTAAGEELVRAFTALPLDGMPAPVFHQAAARDRKAWRSDTVAGGSDRIVEGLATRNAGAITKGVAVSSIRQDAKGVVVADGGGRRFEGSEAVICLPLTPLRALQFEGGTPEPLAERLKDLSVAHEVKLASVSEDPSAIFKERRVSWRLPETHAASFVKQTLAWMPNAERAPDSRAEPGSFAPFAMRSVFRHDFATDPLVGGAYAYARSIGTREGVVRAGRVLFAGADLSDAPGWMEGAVRSAEQAVAAVLA